MTKIEQLIQMYAVEVWGDFFNWSKASDNISSEEYEWKKCLSRNKIEKFENLLKEILQENT